MKQTQEETEAAIAALNGVCGMNINANTVHAGKQKKAAVKRKLRRRQRKIIQPNNIINFWRNSQMENWRKRSELVKQAIMNLVVKNFNDLDVINEMFNIYHEERTKEENIQNNTIK